MPQLASHIAIRVCYFLLDIQSMFSIKCAQNIRKVQFFFQNDPKHFSIPVHSLVTLDKSLSRKGNQPHMFGDHSYYFTHSLETTKRLLTPPDVKNRIMTANFSSAEISHASLFIAFQFFVLFQQIIKSVRADSLCLKNCSLSSFSSWKGM